ncbi:MAG: hypothetical protein QF817_00060 [Candidatus Poseidoniaceae archaeon]|nr:hypothetical protein [Candidatus Poseidoniaceae archaeon]
MTKLWLTVDSDDFHHLPRQQGHPSRSRNQIATTGKPTSDRLLCGMDGFSDWHLQNPSRRAVTIFVIADQLGDGEFCKWLRQLLLASEHITIGCHGLNHRSWSAWGEDIAGFRKALRLAKEQISDFSGAAWRPWFRAPAGYVAPWMSQVLAEEGFTVDSSVNPSLLVKRKAGRGNSWSQVSEAMRSAGVVERKWLTSLLGPACGPALHLPILRGFARRAWRRVSELDLASDSQICDMDSEVVTVYWHLHDHARSEGKWAPPLSIA